MWALFQKTSPECDAYTALARAATVFYCYLCFCFFFERKQMLLSIIRTICSFHFCFSCNGCLPSPSPPPPPHSHALNYETTERPCVCLYAVYARVNAIKHAWQRHHRYTRPHLYRFCTLSLFIFIVHKIHAISIASMWRYRRALPIA